MRLQYNVTNYNFSSKQLFGNKIMLLEMLSKRETQYINDPISFEDKFGLDYSKVIRSRIRKKIDKTMNHIELIIQKDTYGRQPTYEWRNRRIAELTKKINDEKAKKADVKRLEKFQQLNERETGMQTEPMLNRSELLKLIESWVKKDPSMKKQIRKIVKL